jgi:glycosyltransferase involved in cell wall biosynthesis
MIRKFYIIDDFSSSQINGIGTYISQLVYILKTLDFEVFIIAYNYPCRTICFKQYKNTTALCIPIIKTTWEDYFDLVIYFIRLNIISESNIFIFNYAFSGFILKKMKKFYAKSKFIYVIHDMSWTIFFNGDVKSFSKIGIETIKSDIQYNELYKLLINEINIFSEVDQIISLTNVTCKLLENVYRIDTKKITIISNGIQDIFSPCTVSEKQIVKKNHQLKENNILILFVGRVHYTKGINPLIKAFNKIALSNKDVKLIVVGALLPNEKRFEITKDYSSRVIFTGFVSRKEMENWYKIADIAVLPSFFEQCSFAGIEMMMHQIPIVASDGFCVDEMFIHNQNALISKIVEINNLTLFSENLIFSISQLIENQRLSISLAENGRRIYESRYNISNMIQSYGNLFNELLS